MHAQRQYFILYITPQIVIINNGFIYTQNLNYLCTSVAHTLLDLLSLETLIPEKKDTKSGIQFLKNVLPWSQSLYRSLSIIKGPEAFAFAFIPANEESCNDVI